MVVRVRMKNGPNKEFCRVSVCGVLLSYPDRLYIQTCYRNKPKEHFIPLDEIKAYTVTEPT